MTDISIVIPTYNGSRFVLATINSVKRQTYTDWELIIVDDGSKDNTFDIIRNHISDDSRVQLITQENMGESAARNTGYQHTNPKSSFVIFLDHDDMWETETLAELRDALLKHPTAIGAYGIGQFVDIYGQPILQGHLEAWCRLRKKWVNDKWIDCAKTDPTTFESLAAHNSIPTPGVCLLRRTLLPSNPLFPNDMRAGSGDVFLFLRLAQKSYFVFLDEYMIRGRRHANNITNDGKRNDETLVQAYQSIMILQDTTNDQREMLMKGYKWRYLEKSRRHTIQAKSSIMERKIVYALKEFMRAIRSYYRSVTGLPRARP
jgi:glycosyltransferase involved in cell wall biosynthesis